ncbi:MAG: hypothetical protein DI537_20440 [Stutzerimonas stutzeri]|nr:MAG: hypothetical protein DI537_20440 [Stutzerimonas stutzeri]
MSGSDENASTETPVQPTASVEGVRRERVLAEAVEAARVAEVCAILASRYDAKGNIEAANWMPPVSRRVSAAYEAHLKRIADAVASLTPAPTPAEEGAVSDSIQRGLDAAADAAGGYIPERIVKIVRAGINAALSEKERGT